MMKSTTMIKNPLSLLLFGMTMLGGTQAYADTCSAAKVQEILQTATKQNPSVQIDCSLNLPKNAQVSKQLFFAGQQSSGTILDCQGATIQAAYAKPTILITSLLQNNNVWDVPQNIQIKNCNINGSLRIHGMAQFKQDDYLRASSLQPGHTQRAQLAAPHNIVLDHLNITSPVNMLYLSAGVHDITLKNSRFSGATGGLALYLDAESANNIIQGNTFAVQTQNREVIAIDGSANNVIRGNTFVQPAHGGIFLYRNCGETGIIRHQTPSGNQIIGNRFELGQASDKSPVIWVASRNGNRKYCGMDGGYAFGSSANDNDMAQNNTIEDNTFVQPKAKFSLFKSNGAQGGQAGDDMIKVSSQPNQISDNKVSN